MNKFGTNREAASCTVGENRKYGITTLFGTCASNGHAPLLEYRRMKVNCNIYNIGAPAFSINSQNTDFRLYAHVPKKRDNTVIQNSWM